MDFLDKVHKNIISPKLYISHTDDIKNYYLPNDYEIISQLNPSLKQNIQIYNNSYAIHIPNNIPRYECDILLRKIIDYCIENKYMDDLNNNIPLINSQMRNIFYKFIIKNK